VGDRVAALDPLVVPGGDDFPALGGPAGGEHGSDRDAAGIEADPGLVQG
jgi:hypothetical protein